MAVETICSEVKKAMTAAGQCRGIRLVFGGGERKVRESKASMEF